MILKLLRAIFIAVIVAAVVQSLPDIKRYLDIREM